MLKKYDTEIERFISHFQKEIEQTSKIVIEGESHPAHHHKKIVYSAIIDSLSKCVFPRKGNKDRIVSFIIEFSEWENNNRVSLPHLFQLLSKSPEPSFSKLRQFVFEKLSSWSPGATIKLDRDPWFNEVEKYWPVEKEHKKPLNGVSIKFLQHSFLFYSLRNSLVHEFREPGYGIECVNDKNPYYLSCSTVDESNIKETWELVYPVKFFEIIVGNSLRNLEIYLKANNINPFYSYTFGSYWIEYLNR